MARELIVLGTASQAPTRTRAHVSTVLRWDDQLLLFDPGENTQRQAILAGVNINRLTAICISHFHGDHCLGLPGVVQRRALHNSTNEHRLADLPVIFPEEGRAYFDRLMSCSIFHDSSGTVSQGVEADGFVTNVGKLQLSAAALDHRVTTFGYRLEEPPSRKLNTVLLSERYLEGRLIGQLARDGEITHRGIHTRIEDVSTTRAGQSMAFVMDTAECDGAVSLAEGVDLLVCEATFADEQLDLAHKYKHLTASQAGRLAAKAGARRLVLTHFSARYKNPNLLGEQASQHHGDVVVAEDLTTIPVPERPPISDR